MTTNTFTTTTSFGFCLISLFFQRSLQVRLKAFQRKSIGDCCFYRTEFLPADAFLSPNQQFQSKEGMK